jgi:hypothetical protein
VTVVTAAEVKTGGGTVVIVVPVVGIGVCPEPVFVGDELTTNEVEVGTGPVPVGELPITKVVKTVIVTVSPVCVTTTLTVSTFVTVTCTVDVGVVVTTALVTVDVANVVVLL